MFLYQVKLLQQKFQATVTILKEEKNEKIDKFHEGGGCLHLATKFIEYQIPASNPKAAFFIESHAPEKPDSNRLCTPGHRTPNLDKRPFNLF